MGDIVLWVLVIAFMSVVWIEWIPQRYAIFPQALVAISLIPIGFQWLSYWYGWAISLFGAGTLLWLYVSPRRRKDWPDLFMTPVILARRASALVTAMASWFSTKYRDWKRARRTLDVPHLTDDATLSAGDTPAVTSKPVQVWLGTAAIFLLGLVAAIPWMLLATLILVISEMLCGDLPASVQSTMDIARYVLGRTFVALVAAIDMIGHYAFVFVPGFLAIAHVILRWAAFGKIVWRRFIVGATCYGALYPVVFILADILDAFDGSLL